MKTRVSVVRLGCARNDVDADELQARLVEGGLDVRDDPEGAEVVLVNTCGFIASAKKDSIDTILAAADTGARVVVTGCLAERYGNELADSLPEAAAVLSFDDYGEIADRVRRVAEIVLGVAVEAVSRALREELPPRQPRLGDLERTAGDRARLRPAP